MSSKSVEVMVATSAGVCFGVERALKLSEKAIENPEGKVHSLGPLIHNPQKVSELAQKGLGVVENLSDAEGTVVFRSHGVPKERYEEAKQRDLKVVDATCPLVKVPQNFARKLSDAGYFVIIVGDENHPEIKGVRSYITSGEHAVVKGAADIKAIGSHPKVGIICQTTLKKALLDQVVAAAQEKFPEVKVHNTICSATKDRQEAAVELAHQVDCMVVIGGHNSSNTRKLYDISEEITGQAHLVENETELQGAWFEGVHRVGVTAGASTPLTVIERVCSQIKNLTKTL